MFLTLLPLIVIAVTTILVMLSIAIKRCAKLSSLLSLLGVIGAFLSVIYINCLLQSNSLISQDFTHLIIMDHLSIIYMGLVLIGSFVTISLAYPYFKGFPEYSEEFYILILIATLGALLLVISNHFATFFLGLELLSIPMYGLLAYSRERKKSLESGIKYLILSATASATLLFGIAFYYAYTKQLGFTVAPADSSHAFYLVAAAALIIVAVSFKLSIVPFHQWAPDVYQGAPMPVALFLATVSKVAVFAVVVRFLISFNYIGSFESISLIVSVLAIASMILGNLLALKQTHYLRLLGLSSVSHMGYAMIAIVSLSATYATLYITTYVLTSLVAFGIICMVSSPYQRSNQAGEQSQLRGLYFRRPILAILLSIMLLSLTGVPLTLGFIAKLFVVLEAAKYSHWILIAILILGSGISLYYYSQAILNLYSKSNADNASCDSDKCSCSIKFNTVILTLITLAIIFFGIYPNPLITLING